MIDITDIPTKLDDNFNDLSELHKLVNGSKGYWHKCYLKDGEKILELRFASTGHDTLSIDCRATYEEELKYVWFPFGQIVGNTFVPDGGSSKIRRFLEVIDGKKPQDLTYFTTLKMRKKAA